MKHRKIRPRVSVGQEFDNDVPRITLTYLVITLGSIFILGAAAKGFWDNDFGALQLVWTVVGPVYGAIGSYYYYRPRDE
jgi:hypothetical protein